MKDIKGAINRVIKMINETPYIYNTEADIQGLVYSELLKEYKEKYPTGLTDSEGKNFVTNRVHREYFGGEGGRIDTVVFSKEEIEKIDRYWFCIKTSNHPGYRPVKLQDAIEIKTGAYKTKEKLNKEIRKDIDRLTKLLRDKKTKNAHFIFIIRWPTKKEDMMNRMDSAVKLARERCKAEGVMFYCGNGY
jgi:hypothetical protein